MLFFSEVTMINLYAFKYFDVLKSFKFKSSYFVDCKGDNNTWCYQYFDYEYNNNSKTGGSCCSSKTNYLCEYPAATQFSAATAANKLKVRIAVHT